MNHLDQDETPDWNDDIDALENQLRSLRPTPARSWDSIAESIEESRNQSRPAANVAPSMPAWASIASHTVTAAIGLSVGVAIMLMQPSNDPGLIDTTGNSSDSNAPVQLVDDQVTDKAHQIASDLEAPEATLVADKKLPGRRRLSRANWSSSPLRVFGSTDERWVNGHDWLMEPNRDQDFNLPEDSDADTNDSERTYDEPIDKPVLSPGSFRQVIDELTYLPNPDNPFCKAKGFSS